MPTHSPQLSPEVAVAAAAANSPHPILTVSPRASSSVVLRRALAAYPQHTAPPTVITVDLSTLAENLARFRAHLPSVALHYAIKCLPDRAVLSVLAALAVGFDVASPVELDLALDVLRSAGHPHPPAAIVYANPVKAPADLRRAAAAGVDLVTLDSVSEIEKLRLHLPRARALLRIATDDATSTIPLSAKFGVHMRDIDSLLAAAARNRVNLVGVAFHVGSGAASPQPYRTAMRHSREVFARARHFGHTFTVLDIGGGFPPASERASFSAIANAVQDELQAFPPAVTVIAEPGRFFVASAVNIATRVLRASHTPHSRSLYAIGDGVYGVFRDACISNETFVPRVLLRDRANAARSGARLDGPVLAADGIDEDDEDDDDDDDDDDEGDLNDEDETTECDLYGPTEERCDVVAAGCRLPRMHPGDWLWFEHVGGYTLSMRTRRSDIETPAIFYVYRSAAALPGSESGVDVGPVPQRIGLSNSQASTLSD